MTTKQATATAQTAGQELTAELRRYFRVGARTRRYRNSADLHDSMIEALHTATVYPGCYSQRTNDIFASAWGVYLSYAKHVGGYRIDGMLRYRISQMSPYQFAALLGRMLDEGIQNTGDGERFFSEMAREAA